MVGNSLPYLSEEKTVTKAVRIYSCLYVKSCKNYKSKICMKYSWAEVDKEMGFAEGKANLTEASTERWSLALEITKK